MKISGLFVLYYFINGISNSPIFTIISLPNSFTKLKKGKAPLPPAF